MKISPKALVVAAVVVPGTKKLTSVVLLFTAVKSFCGLKVWKSFGNPNRGGVAGPALALTRKPVPGVLKTTPRGEFTLKKLAGSKFGSENKSGTPSQLISRRRPPRSPFAPATAPPPTADRKASRVGVIPATVGLADSKVINDAEARLVNPAVNIDPRSTARTDR